MRTSGYPLISSPEATEVFLERLMKTQRHRTAGSATGRILTVSLLKLADVFCASSEVRFEIGVGGVYLPGSKTNTCIESFFSVSQLRHG